MKHLSIGIMILIATIVLTSDVCAQRGPHSGWGPGTTYGRLYNPRTVETVRGEVVSVERFTPAGGMSQGVHMLIRTRGGDLFVHLGPAFFVDRQRVKLRRGDRVEVTGSRIDFHGRPAIIAQEVRKGDRVLRLRDFNGIPLWAERGRGARL